MVNYDKLLVDLVLENQKKNLVPTILLHSCCAPCSSYVISYLADFFEVTVFYYNPNIFPYEEYLKRKEEQIRLINNLKVKYKVKIIDCDYDNDIYQNKVRGFEMEPERGSRCSICFMIRLSKTAIMAKEHNFDYFATTLTLSPYKNANVINEIGLALAKEYDVKYLGSDFKKRNGYKKSIELSKEYNLYRQDYCGCIYSKRDRDIKMQEKLVNNL